MTYQGFRMGGAFPADDLVSEWLVTLGFPFNDMIIVFERMEADAGTPYKFFYWTRLMISHFAEAALFLDETKDIPAIAEFIDSLPEEAQQNYHSVLDVFESHGAELHAIRSHVFHYPEMKIVEGQKKARVVERALQIHADNQAVIKVGKMGAARLLFADDIAAEVFQRMSGGEDNVMVLHGAISQATNPLMRFMNEAMEEHLIRRRADGLVLRPVRLIDPDDWTKGWKDA